MSFVHIRILLSLMTLPEWIGSITSLQILSIIDCPHLEKRCQKDIAPQSAIPDIENIFSVHKEIDMRDASHIMEHILNRLIGLGRKPNSFC
nr:hypothetical protein CFP56_71804 [Quercus suber]